MKISGNLTSTLFNVILAVFGDMNQIESRERTVSELVAFSRALGETLLAKQLTLSDLSTLDQRVKLYREERLTKLVQDLQVDRKALIEEQQHHNRQISRLRKSVEISRRKLLV